MRSSHSQTALIAWLSTAFIAAAATNSPWRWSLDSSQVWQGEWWRLITGHFVHLSWQHYHYDLLALGLALALCIAVDLRSTTIARTALFSAAAVSAALLLINPVDIYGGLSGITAGLLARGTLQMINKGGLLSGVILLLCLLLKILLEQQGITVSGVAPVWQAHAAGAVAAITLAACSRKHTKKTDSFSYSNLINTFNASTTR